MNLYSSTINYKPDHLINAESNDASLERASRMFHIPIEEMPKQRSKTRKCSANFQEPTNVDSQRDEFLNSESIYNALENNVSSTIADSCMYNMFIDSFYDEMDDDQIWCALTDELVYTVDEDLNSPYHYRVEKIPTCLNSSLYNPANSNIPCTKPIFQAKHDQYNKATAERPFLNDRYPEVISMVSTEYNPSVNICATYLWSDKESPSVHTPTSWFPRGYFNMNRHGVTMGKLANGSQIKVYTLLDSGATKPMLNKRFYEQTPFLHSYPRYNIKPRSIKVVDNNYINVSECIKFVISFSCHYFEFITYLVNMLDDFDFVIGSKSMFELEGDVKCSNLSFEFAQRSMKFINTKNFVCPPHSHKKITFKLVDAPPGFHSGNVVAKMITSAPNQLPQTVKLKVEHGKIEIKLYNDSDVPCKIAKYQMGDV